MTVDECRSHPGPFCAFEDCDNEPDSSGYCERHTGGEYQPTSAEEDDPHCCGN